MFKDVFMSFHVCEFCHSCDDITTEKLRERQTSKLNAKALQEGDGRSCLAATAYELVGRVTENALLRGRRKLM